MHNIINAIILGIVEGLTEFLPISSTGHLILVNQFIHFSGAFDKTFDIVIQLGAILAVVVFFWSSLFPFGRGKSAKAQAQIWTLWFKIVVAVLPALVLGFLFGENIKNSLFNPLVVALALLLGGIVLLLIENKKPRSSINDLNQISYPTAFFIGLIQCLAMIPGTSRAAATIIGAMLLGASRVVAAEFSFFLAIPTLAAASLFALLKNGAPLSGVELLLLAVGFVVSFVVAWLVIAGFIKFISRHDFKLFGWYRIVLALLVLGYFYLR